MIGLLKQVFGHRLTTFQESSQQMRYNLKAGEPDTTTKVTLPDIILDMIVSVVKSLLWAFKHVGKIMSEESVQANLNNTVFHTFRKFIEIPDQDKCESLTANLTAGMSSQICRSFQY